MRPLFQLDPRLMECASLVKEGAAVADICTDHAYLPVWLARKGQISHAIACDIREGPLERAMEHIEKYQVSSMVEARLSDGLENIRPHEVDTVVIAGMGGEVMIHILQRAPWLKQGTDLILQPMTSVDKLRVWLAGEGYQIQKERAVRAQGKIYSAMKVRYIGNIPDPDPLYPYIGLVWKEKTDEAAEYIHREISRQSKRESGLRIQGKEEQAEEVMRIIQQMKKRLDDMKKEESM